MYAVMAPIYSERAHFRVYKPRKFLPSEDPFSGILFLRDSVHGRFPICRVRTIFMHIQAFHGLVAASESPHRPVFPRRLSPRKFFSLGVFSSEAFLREFPLRKVIPSEVYASIVIKLYNPGNDHFVPVWDAVDNNPAGDHLHPVPLSTATKKLRKSAL